MICWVWVRVLDLGVILRKRTNWKRGVWECGGDFVMGWMLGGTGHTLCRRRISVEVLGFLASEGQPHVHLSSFVMRSPFRNTPLVLLSLEYAPERVHARRR
jgi:hypothetical protein